MTENTTAQTCLESAAFDYSIRIAELVKWMRETGNSFPLTDRLLVCGTEIGLACRELENEEGTGFMETVNSALSRLREADYITQIAVTGGYLTKMQSVHIRKDGNEIAKVLDVIKNREEKTK